MTLTLSGYAGCKITSITLSMRSNSSAGAGYLSIKAGTTTLATIGSSSSGVKFNNAAWHGSWSTSYVNVTPTMSNTTYTIQNGENVVIVIGATTNSLYCQSFTITYEEAASYNITATSNDNSLGTVSISGNTITATPEACVGYASPAYEVTSGTATVSQSGNTFTVTASSNCNVQINFAESAKDTYIDKVHNTDMTGKDYCGSYEAPTIKDKDKVTASEQTGVCDHDHYHFVGWVATGITGSQENEPDGLIKAGTAMTASGKTYYAVWAQEKEL